MARKQKKVVALEPIPKESQLLAIDASSACIGYALFRRGSLYVMGAIKSPASWDSPKRIKANTRSLRTITTEYVCESDDPCYVVQEWQSHKSTRINAQGLAVLGQAQGAAWQMFEQMPWAFRNEQISERVWTKQGGKNVKKITRHNQALMLFPEYARMLRSDPRADDGMDISDSLMLGLWRLSTG